MYLLDLDSVVLILVHSSELQNNLFVRKSTNYLRKLEIWIAKSAMHTLCFCKTHKMVKVGMG